MLPSELEKERYNSIERFYKLLFTSSLMKISNETQEDVFKDSDASYKNRMTDFSKTRKFDDQFFKRILQPVFYKKRAFLPIPKICILDTLLEIRKLSKASKTLSRILGFQERFIERNSCKELYT
ncbi:hypothetical protein M9H77_04137 [Catharanthus roseus]|uniref:Uncharacterized protein n=1 Tax=Catharanthus roseus TaxID=4058 RepID=A0ACC0CD85_CATRO|nr:hypothetical protein M9H77_04137 [Catharanthus roseus]